MRRSDFGHISIRPDHSLVELPADLSNETLEALRRTRISGVLIQLQPDFGSAAGRDRAVAATIGQAESSSATGTAGKGRASSTRAAVPNGIPGGYAGGAGAGAGCAASAGSGPSSGTKNEPTVGST